MEDRVELAGLGGWRKREGSESCFLVFINFTQGPFGRSFGPPDWCAALPNAKELRNIRQELNNEDLREKAMQPMLTVRVGSGSVCNNLCWINSLVSIRIFAEHTSC